MAIVYKTEEKPCKRCGLVGQWKTLDHDALGLDDFPLPRSGLERVDQKCKACGFVMVTSTQPP